MSKSTLNSLGPDDTARLQSCMDSGLRVLQEISDLRGGLKDTVKAVAEELGVKPAVLSKALNVAFKASMEADRETTDTVEDILQVTGHG